MAGAIESVAICIQGAREQDIGGAGFWVGPKHILTLGLTIGQALGKSGDMFGGAVVNVGPIAGRALPREEASVVSQGQIVIEGKPITIALLEVISPASAHPANFRIDRFDGGAVEVVGFPTSTRPSWDNGTAEANERGTFVVDWRGNGYRRGFTGGPAFARDSDEVVGIIVSSQSGFNAKSLLIPNTTLVAALPALKEFSPSARI